MGAKLGQHFLKDPVICERIAESLFISPSENIVEIGPGKGILTDVLLSYRNPVTVIEIDKKMVEILSEKYSDTENLKIINDDILKTQMEQYMPDKICGNLPYYISGKILEKIIMLDYEWDLAVLMLPGPVADRITADTGNSDMSAITVAVATTCEAELLFKVKREEFHPVPAIDSAVVRIKRKESHLEKKFYKFIRDVFSQKRKKIKNNIKNKLNIDSERFNSIVSSIDISESLRPHEMKISDFRRLYNLFVKEKIL